MHKNSRPNDQRICGAKRTEWRVATHQRKLEWNIRKEKRTNLPIRSIGRLVSFKHDHRPATYCLFGSIIEQLQAYINYRPFHRTMFLSGAWFAISRVLLKTATEWRDVASKEALVDQENLTIQIQDSMVDLTQLRFIHLHEIKITRQFLVNRPLSWPVCSGLTRLVLAQIETRIARIACNRELRKISTNRVRLDAGHR